LLALRYAASSAISYDLIYLGSCDEEPK